MIIPMKKENILITLKPYTTKLAVMKKHIYEKIGVLDVTYASAKEPIPFSEREALAVTPIKKGEKWGKNYDCGWFHFTGVVPECAKGKKVSVLIHVGGEGCLFDNEGHAINGITNIGNLMDVLQPVYAKQEIVITESAEGNDPIDLWIETGYNKFLTIFPDYAKLKKMNIVIVRDDVKALYYDYLSLLTQHVCCKDAEKKASLKRAIKVASSLMKNYEPQNVARAREVIKGEFKQGKEIDHTIYATGHAHLDLAWLWPIRETRRKGARTFSNQLRNIENYPDYIFGASQPQLFAWLKEDYPSLYKEVKAAIKDERIEIQGGMWVETDTNVPCGESLIRQCLYGLEFWQKEFGKVPKMCWLPDVFGFSGNLPQIVKKCNMDYFLTIKLSWNEQNKWPYHTFIWEGIDNSSIITHLPPNSTYNSDGNVLSVEAIHREYSEKDKIPVSSMLFGVGDGGGGPGEGHIESIVRASQQKGLAKVKLDSADSFFAELSKYEDKMVRHKGELYLEKHQGTYTTQAKTKLYNRRCEQALHNVEYLSLLASFKGYNYPKAEIDKIWKEVLLYQFHDIIPGSSINRVYVEAEARYLELLKQLKELQEKALSALSSSDKLVAINTTPFTRAEFIKYQDKWYLAKTSPYSAAALKEESYIQCNTSDNHIENDLLKVEFDANGEITSLITKEDNIEHSKIFLNRLSVYKDKKLHYNAWDIDINYTKKTADRFKLIDQKTEIDGPCAIRTNTYKYNNSKLVQQVVLTMGKPYVEFRTKVDWQEKHKMLRADFKPMTYSDKVRCDIQFGNLKRNTGDDNSLDKAQYEICAHKWVDLEDSEYGLSLINDCKYGHRVKQGLISLNLLRSPVYPDPTADRGEQNFTYALYPYKGRFEDNNTQEYAYELNNKLIVTKGNEFPTLASSDKKNIVIETIKKAEDGKGTVLRIFENQGKETTAKIETKIEYKECFEANMLETPQQEATLSKLKFTPYEIKTILLK